MPSYIVGTRADSDRELGVDVKYNALSSAASIEEVVNVTSDYLGSWTAQELDRLPASCRPGWVRTHHDIEFWADRLVLEGDKAVLYLDDERKLDRMTSHFLIASVRLRQLGYSPSMAQLTAAA